ncbi:MAG TPA: Calx-beta domain-containing protein [Actinomycetota bacterium]|nr:Calx-beta domain-containing protein [Actinomycetota bacterium]
MVVAGKLARNTGGLPLNTPDLLPRCAPVRRRLVSLILVLTLVPLLAVSGDPAGAASHEHAPGTPPHDHGAQEAAGGPENRSPAGRGPAISSVKRAEKDPCAGKKLRLLPRAVKCTHGPDPAPGGRDVARSVAPLSPTAAAAETAAATQCDGDGVTGPRTEILYARSSDVASRYSAFLPSFRAWAGEANEIYRASAADTGGNSHIRFVHNASCVPTVTEVVMSRTADDTFDDMIADLESRGFNRTDRKYLVFVDATVYCGIGTIHPDDQPGAGNASNVGPSYGRVDAGCWSGDVAAHEHMHNLGGVQYSAPNTSQGFHCVDEWDVMCYSDEPMFPPMQVLCPNYERNFSRFDCNSDDYFHSNPAEGSYLATHWNTYNSLFLVPAAGNTCPDTGFEPDNSVSEARLLRSGANENRAFCVPGDEDWTALEAMAGRTYQVQTLNLSAGTDTTLELYAADGSTLLDTSFDHEGTPASLLTFTAPESTTYYVRATQSDGGGGLSFTYQIRIDQQCPDFALEPDETPAGAGSLAVGDVATRAFCITGDVDWTRFSGNAGHVYTVETLNLQRDVDTYLELYAGDGTTLLAENDDANFTRGSMVVFTAPVTGDYYVKTRPYFDGDPGRIETYDLRVAQGGTAVGVDDVTATEGDSGTTDFTFTLSRWGVLNGPASVTYATEDADAVAAEDYTAVGPSTLLFGPGEATKTVTVAVKGDSAFEIDELFLLRLSDPGGTAVVDHTGFGTILNDDEPAAFSVNDVSILEGASSTRNAVFTVSRSGPAGGPASVQYATSDGTALAGSDYTARSLTTLSFAAGESSKTVPVAVRGDTVAEPDETFFVNLSNPINAGIGDGSGQATIVNDDLPGSFTVNDVRVVERNADTRNLVFTVRRDGSTAGRARVWFSTQNGTATAPSDYTARSLTELRFSPGTASKTVAVTVKGDRLVEPDESFFLKLSNPTGAVIFDDTGVGTIVNDD